MLGTMPRRTVCALFLLSAFFILTCSCSKPAHAADFGPVFKDTILPHEGGFTKNRNDPGNWTGGVVGKGLLLGTNRGIAANTYGAELLRKGRTIKGLTEAECKALYQRDYWDAYHFGELKSQGIADELCDEVVNMGEGGGRSLLAKVFREIEWTTMTPIPVPADFTPATIAWINSFTKDRGHRIAFYNSIRIKRVKFYDTLVKRKPKMRQFFLSWIDRAVD